MKLDQTGSQLGAWCAKTFWILLSQIVNCTLFLVLLSSQSSQTCDRGKLQRAHWETRCLRKEEGATHSEAPLTTARHMCSFGNPLPSLFFSLRAMAYVFNRNCLQPNGFFHMFFFHPENDICKLFCLEEFATLSDQYAAEIAKLDEQCRERAKRSAEVSCRPTQTERCLLALQGLCGFFGASGAAKRPEGRQRVP